MEDEITFVIFYHSPITVVVFIFEFREEVIFVQNRENLIFTYGNNKSFTA